MRNLSDSDAVLVRQELQTDPQGVGYAGKTPVEVAVLLCTQPQVPNPELQPTRRVPMTDARITAVIASIAPDMPLLVAMLSGDTVLTIGDRLRNGEATSVVNTLMLAKYANPQVAASIDKAIAIIEATALDPAWPAMVPGECPLCRVTEGRNRGVISAAEVTELLGG